MPATKLTKKITADKEREAKLAALPQDVRQAVEAMEPEEQDAYLASLDRVDQMAEAGKTIAPPKHGGYSSAQSRARSKFRPDADQEAPWGWKADGTPRAKPGRKPSQAPGQRTKEKMERVTKELDLAYLEEILGEYEDEDDEPIVLGQYDHGAPAEQTPATSLEEREAAEQAEQEAALKEALERAGMSPSGRAIVSPEFTGQRRVEPDDPTDPLALPTIEERRYRVTADDVQYALEELVDGSWKEVSSGYDVTGLSFHFAFHRIKAPGFSEAIRGLPRYRPKRQAYLDSLQPKDAPKLTPAEREAHVREVREAMIKQRRSNALHRGCYEGDPQPEPVGEWIKDMLA